MAIHEFNPLTVDVEQAILAAAYNAEWAEPEPKLIRGRWFWFITRAGRHISAPTRSELFRKASDVLTGARMEP